jgi:hypothetical protein
VAGSCQISLGLHPVEAVRHVGIKSCNKEVVRLSVYDFE